MMMSLQLSFEAFAHAVIFQELITLVKELATGNKFVLYMCVVHCPELSQIYLWKAVNMPQRFLPFVGLLSKASNTVHTSHLVSYSHEEINKHPIVVVCRSFESML
jgi:hypothetical protein